MPLFWPGMNARFTTCIWRFAVPRGQYISKVRRLVPFSLTQYFSFLYIFSLVFNHFLTISPKCRVCTARNRCATSKCEEWSGTLSLTRWRQWSSVKFWYFCQHFDLIICYLGFKQQIAHGTINLKLNCRIISELSTQPDRLPLPAEDWRMDPTTHLSMPEGLSACHLRLVGFWKFMAQRFLLNLSRIVGS